MRTRSEARRQVIIDAAHSVFKTKGFADTSMSEIATCSNSAKATLYSYFASKDELFVEVIRQFAEHHIKGIFCQLDPQNDVKTTLSQFGFGFVGILCHPEILPLRRNLLAEVTRTTVGRLFYERGPLQVFNELEQYLRATMRLCKLREANAALAARQFVALLRAESEDLMDYGLRDGYSDAEIKAMVAAAVDTFLRAYANR